MRSAPGPTSPADILPEPSHRPRRAYPPHRRRALRAAAPSGPLVPEPGRQVRCAAQRPRRAMAFDTATKQEIIKEYATTERDTGSPEVQVALLTHRIKYLTEHLKTHKHDHHTRRGLMLLVGQRKRLLQYLRDDDIERYRSLIQRVGIR